MMEHHHKYWSKMGELCLHIQADGSSLMRKYRIMAEDQGLQEQATQLALDEMLAAILWLKDVYGTRAVYEVVQQNADDLLTDALKQPQPHR